MPTLWPKNDGFNSCQLVRFSHVLDIGIVLLSSHKTLEFQACKMISAAVNGTLDLSSFVSSTLNTTLHHKFPLSITCMLFSYDRGILVTYVSSHCKSLFDKDSNAFQCLPSWIRRSEDDAWRSVRLRRR